MSDAQHDPAPDLDRADPAGDRADPAGDRPVEGASRRRVRTDAASAPAAQPRNDGSGTTS